jgi:hypothetical protein
MDFSFLIDGWWPLLQYAVGLNEVDVQNGQAMPPDPVTQRIQALYRGFIAGTQTAVDVPMLEQRIAELLGEMRAIVQPDLILEYRVYCLSAILYCLQDNKRGARDILTYVDGLEHNEPTTTQWATLLFIRAHLEFNTGFFELASRHWLDLIDMLNDPNRLTFLDADERKSLLAHMYIYLARTELALDHIWTPPIYRTRAFDLLWEWGLQCGFLSGGQTRQEIVFFAGLETTFVNGMFPRPLARPDTCWLEQCEEYLFFQTIWLLWHLDYDIPRPPGQMTAMITELTLMLNRAITLGEAIHSRRLPAIYQLAVKASLAIYERTQASVWLLATQSYLQQAWQASGIVLGTATTPTLLQWLQYLYDFFRNPGAAGVFLDDVRRLATLAREDDEPYIAAKFYALAARITYVLSGNMGSTASSLVADPCEHINSALDLLDIPGQEYPSLYREVDALGARLGC